MNDKGQDGFPLNERCCSLCRTTVETAITMLLCAVHCAVSLKKGGSALEYNGMQTKQVRIAGVVGRVIFIIGLKTQQAAGAVLGMFPEARLACSATGKVPLHALPHGVRACY